MRHAWLPIAIATSCTPSAPSEPPAAAPVAPVATVTAPAVPSDPPPPLWAIELSREVSPPPPSPCEEDDTECIDTWAITHIDHAYHVHATHRGRRLPPRFWTAHTDLMWADEWSLQLLDATTDHALALVETNAVRSECVVRRVFVIRVTEDGVETLWESDDTHWDAVTATVEATGVVLDGSECEVNGLSDHAGERRDCRITIDPRGGVDRSCGAWGEARPVADAARQEGIMGTLTADGPGLLKQLLPPPPASPDGSPPPTDATPTAPR